MGDVLSSCEEYKWSLYKQHHDAIMMAFVCAVAKKWRYNNKTNMVPIAKYENEKGAIWVDITIPTDHVVHAQ